MRSLTAADLEVALPDLTTPQRFESLRTGAVIRRDLWGIPHIRAEDEYDLFFAQGFATAQDRLFQMDFDRLRALGRAAEYLGSRALPQDRLMRRRQLERVSKLDYALASDAARNAIDAYTDGVNAFLDTTPSLPIEYTLLGVRPERWEAWHSIAVFKVRNTAEGSFQGKLWLSKLAAHTGPEGTAKWSPGYLSGGLLTVPPGERYRGPLLNAVDELRLIVEATSMLNNTDGGSNCWALSGEYTASGLPLLAGDSHRGLEMPNVYYQMHLIGPDIRVLGYSIPGFPMVLHFCHNQHVAWGMTMGNVDTQDLFVEQFRTSGEQIEYLHEEAWRKADIAIETLWARGGGDERLEVVTTHHGPVIAGEPRDGVAITLADPGSKQGTRWIDAAYDAMKAESADAFEIALEGWTDRVNNYIYADVRGNFGYALRGRIPVRRKDNGWGAVPGWTGRHEWDGYISAAALPRSRNPRAGWVVSCNQRIVDETYPFYLSHLYGTRYRAERIVDRLEELKRAHMDAGYRSTIADMSSIHGDVVSIPAQSLQRALTNLAGLSARAANAAKALLEWNCTLTADSAHAALYEVTTAVLSRHFIKARYGALADGVLNSSDAGAEEHWRLHIRPSMFIAVERGDPSWLPDGEDWGSLLSKSLEAAIAYLEDRFGVDWTQCRWGDLHQCGQLHPLSASFPDAAMFLDVPRVETAGDGDTPLMTGSKLAGNFLTASGSVTRYVHDPSNWSNGRWIVPLGASGHPGSPHYLDQQKLWVTTQTIPQLWDWDEIERNCETEQWLNPVPISAQDDRPC